MPHYNILNGQRTSEEGKRCGEAIHMHKYVFLCVGELAKSATPTQHPHPRNFDIKASVVGGAI